MNEHGLLRCKSEPILHNRDRPKVIYTISTPLITVSHKSYTQSDINLELLHLYRAINDPNTPTEIGDSILVNLTKTTNTRLKKIFFGIVLLLLLTFIKIIVTVFDINV